MGKIAVFTDENGKLANFYQCVQIRIYEKGEEKFQLAEQISYEKIEPQNPIQIRKKTEELMECIKDCKTVAFLEILGIPYAVFDKWGCNIFSITEDSVEQLEAMELEVQAVLAEEEKRKAMGNQTVPMETETPGVFFFDFILAQEANPEISSKKALKAFLDTVPFMELRLVSAHVPPWLARDERFQIKTEKNGKALYSVIHFKQC